MKTISHFIDDGRRLWKSAAVDKSERIGYGLGVGVILGSGVTVGSGEGVGTIVGVGVGVGVMVGTGVGVSTTGVSVGIGVGVGLSMGSTGIGVAEGSSGVRLEKSSCTSPETGAGVGVGSCVVSGSAVVSPPAGAKMRESGSGVAWLSALAQPVSSRQDTASSRRIRFI